MEVRGPLRPHRLQCPKAGTAPVLERECYEVEVQPIGTDLKPMIYIYIPYIYNRYRSYHNNIYLVQYPMYINIRVQWTVHKIGCII